MNVENFQGLIAQSIMHERILRRTGDTCEYYVDSARLLFNPKLVILAAERMLEIAYERGATYVGGEATSALPLVGAIMTLSCLKGRPLHGFMIRKELKTYGKSRIIEGDLPYGSRVLLVDDVTGMGSAAKRCCKLLQEIGIDIVGYSSIVDRLEQARHDLWEEYGVELLPLSTIDEVWGRADD